jgi:hypothetical protein
MTRHNSNAVLNPCTCNAPVAILIGFCADCPLHVPSAIAAISAAGAAAGPCQAYQDLLVGAVSGLKAHLEAPGNALVVDLVIAQGGVALIRSMEELLKVSNTSRARVRARFPCFSWVWVLGTC